MNSGLGQNSRPSCHPGIVSICLAVQVVVPMKRIQAVAKGGTNDTMIISAHGSQSVIYNRLKSDGIYVIGQRRVIVIGRRCRR